MPPAPPPPPPPSPPPPSQPGGPQPGALRQAVAFLTPAGGAAEPSPDAFTWFPIVGILLGAGVGAVWWGADRAWPPLVAAALVLLVDLASTGLLHVDGLADTADGLLPHLAPDDRLRVMREPGIGAFGVAAVAGVLVLRFAALAALVPAPLLLAGLWCASRSLMVLLAVRLPYARAGGGLATAFLGGRAEPIAFSGLLTALVLAALWERVAGAAAVTAALLVGLGMSAFARRRLGGFTGDVLGATGLLAETVGLAVAAAKWTA